MAILLTDRINISTKYDHFTAYLHGYRALLKYWRYPTPHPLGECVPSVEGWSANVRCCTTKFSRATTTNYLESRGTITLSVIAITEPTLYIAIPKNFSEKENSRIAKAIS